ncbi:unnamed protein product [Closterium sp. Yama58-4]|nr:unnamed protein product [Closterium sp. Yama58-4]
MRRYGQSEAEAGGLHLDDFNFTGVAENDDFLFDNNANPTYALTCLIVGSMRLDSLPSENLNHRSAGIPSRNLAMTLAVDLHLQPYRLAFPSPSLSVTINEAFLAAALVTVAYAKKSRKVSPYSSETFRANLFGELEVPQNDSEAARNAVGDPDGLAIMKLIIYTKRGQAAWLEYKVKAYVLQDDTVPPTMTLVHNGTEGSNGPIVLDLPCKYQIRVERGVWVCHGFLGKTVAQRTASFVSTLEAIRKNPSGFYGNINTEAHPDGAARGQLEKYTFRVGDVTKLI